MAITLGDTTITGLGVGGLPNGVVNADDIATGAITRAKMGYAGAVLQVVNFQENTRYNYSGDWHNTVITAAITPISASSKIMVLIHLGRVGHYEANTLAFRIVRNGSLVLVGNAIGSRQSTSAVIMRITTDDNHTQGALFLSGLDSPGTTSACTYTLQANAEGNSNWYLNRNGSGTDSSNQYNSTSQSNITLMEIAG
jgi:hypothetical protein